MSDTLPTHAQLPDARSRQPRTRLRSGLKCLKLREPIFAAPPLGERGRSPESSTSSSATMEKGGETGGDGAPREHLSESSPDEEVLTSPSLSYVKMQSMPTSRSLDILSDNSAASRRGRFLTRRATEYPIQLNQVSSDEDEDEVRTVKCQSILWCRGSCGVCP